MNVQHVLDEREKTHGSFTSHAALSQQLKAVLKERKQAWKDLYHYQREALEMICHKMARVLNGNSCEADHWVDIAGYATLVANNLMPTSKRGNTCDCEICKASASTITGRVIDKAQANYSGNCEDVYEEDIKI